MALRFTLAGLLLLGLLRVLSPKSWPGRRDLLSLVGVGVVGVGMNNVAFTLGVSMTTASETALIYAAVPIWGMILGSLIGLERPTRGGIVGVVVAILGVGVVVGGGRVNRASSGICWWWPRCAGDPTPCSRCRC